MFHLWLHFVIGQSSHLAYKVRLHGRKPSIIIGYVARPVKSSFITGRVVLHEVRSSPSIINLTVVVVLVVEVIMVMVIMIAVVVTKMMMMMMMMMMVVAVMMVVMIIMAVVVV